MTTTRSGNAMLPEHIAVVFSNSHDANFALWQFFTYQNALWLFRVCHNAFWLFFSLI
jgi:hypothetical protein